MAIYTTVKLTLTAPKSAHWKNSQLPRTKYNSYYFRMNLLNTELGTGEGGGGVFSEEFPTVYGY